METSAALNLGATGPQRQAWFHALGTGDQGAPSRVLFCRTVSPLRDVEDAHARVEEEFEIYPMPESLDP